MTMLSGRYKLHLPGSVVIGGGRSSGAGSFPPQHMPLILGNASEGLKNSTVPAMSPRRVDRRRRLAEAVDKQLVPRITKKGKGHLSVS